MDDQKPSEEADNFSLKSKLHPMSVVRNGNALAVVME